MHCLQMPILKSELVLKVGYSRQREHAGQEGPVFAINAEFMYADS